MNTPRIPNPRCDCEGYCRMRTPTTCLVRAAMVTFHGQGPFIHPEDPRRRLLDSMIEDAEKRARPM